MRLLFVGSTQLGRSCLEALAKLDSLEICGVLTAPPQFRISYAPEGVRNVLHTDFSSVAEKIGCPLLVLEEKMSSSELAQDVESLSPDCIFVVGWYHMIPKSWLSRWPTFGIHASLLPAYAGGAPLVWAIIEGSKHVGVTLFQFDDGVDSGPIVGQRRIRVRRKDSIATVLKKVEPVSIALAVDEIPRVLTNESPRTAQKLEGRRIYPQRTPDDGLITDSMTIKQIRDFVRAQTRPYPGAYVDCAGGRLSVWSVGRTSLTFKSRHDLFERSGELFLGRGHRCIKLREVSGSNPSVTEVNA
jgi:methionyl-tRNA formyltransferase